MKYTIHSLWFLFFYFSSAFFKLHCICHCMLLPLSKNRGKGSDLPLFCEFSWAKSCFSRNLCNLEFCVKFLYTDFATSSIWSFEFAMFTNRNLFVLKVILWAVVHTSLHYWQRTLCHKISVMWPHLNTNMLFCKSMRLVR